MERKKEFKFYEAPEMEVVDVELEGYLQNWSVGQMNPEETEAV